MADIKLDKEKIEDAARMVVGRLGQLRMAEAVVVLGNALGFMVMAAHRGQGQEGVEELQRTLHAITLDFIEENTTIGELQ